MSPLNLVETSKVQNTNNIAVDSSHKHRSRLVTVLSVTTVDVYHSSAQSRALTLDHAHIIITHADLGIDPSPNYPTYFLSPVSIKTQRTQAPANRNVHRNSQSSKQPIKRLRCLRFSFTQRTQRNRLRCVRCVWVETGLESHSVQSNSSRLARRF